MYILERVRTGGKLSHGLPPAVVTASVSVIIRSGILHASSMAKKDELQVVEFPSNRPWPIIPPRETETTCRSRCSVQPT